MIRALLPLPLGLGWVDTVGLSLATAMVLLGAARGLWWQVIRLVGIAGAVVLARAFAPRLSPRVAIALPDVPDRFVHGALWLLVFLVGLAAATGCGALGRRLLVSLRLGWVDRAGGALAGLLTGLVVHLIFVAVLFQLAPEAWIARNVRGSNSEHALVAVSDRWTLILGPEAAQRIEGLLRGVEPESAAPADTETSAQAADAETSAAPDADETAPPAVDDAR